MAIFACGNGMWEWSKSFFDGLYPLFWNEEPSILGMAPIGAQNAYSPSLLLVFIYKCSIGYKLGLSGENLGLCWFIVAFGCPRGKESKSGAMHAHAERCAQLMASCKDERFIQVACCSISFKYVVWTVAKLEVIRRSHSEGIVQGDHIS